MKTLLLATDFSDAATDACNYGFKLADYLNAKVILFSAYQAVSPAGFDTPVFFDQHDIQQKVDRQLLDLARTLDDVRRPDVYTDSIEGPVAESILRKIKESHVDLVILGMKHDHKTLRTTFGSTITNLLKKISIPMIVIPQGVTFHELENIAVAIQSDEETANLVPRQVEILNEIGARFNANVFLVKVSSDKTQEAFALLKRPDKLLKFLKPVQPEFESISNKDTAEGLFNFIQNKHIDLLGLFPHDHSMIERLVHASFTKQMIYDAKLPLIIFPKHFSLKEFPDFNPQSAGKSKNKAS